MTLIDKIKIGLGVIGVLAIAVLWAYNASLRASYTAARTTISDQAISIQGLETELSANQKALEYRTQAVQKLTAQTREIEAKLEDVYQNNPDARAWADESCPDSVFVCLLGQALSAVKANAPAGGVSPGSSGTGAEGKDQR